MSFAYLELFKYLCHFVRGCRYVTKYIFREPNGFRQSVPSRWFKCLLVTEKISKSFSFGYGGGKMFIITLNHWDPKPFLTAINFFDKGPVFLRGEIWVA